jgi:hypothetical protein
MITEAAERGSPMVLEHSPDANHAACQHARATSFRSITFARASVGIAVRSAAAAASRRS